MKLLSTRISNIKSIPETNECQKLTFCKENDATAQPYSTIISGENGCGKSTILECTALLSHANVIPEIKSDPRIDDSKCFTEISLDLTGRHETSSQNNTPRKYKPGIKGTVVFTAVDINEKPSRSIASLISTHIIKEDLLKKHWRIYFAPDNNHDFNETFISMIEFNRPKTAIDGKDIESSNPYDHINLQTKRATTLRDIDEKDTSYVEQKRLLELNGCCIIVNTDANDFGCGNNIFESPKNIPTDLPKVLLFRLPCMRKSKTDGVFKLRHIDKIKEAWSEIFSKELVNVTCKRINGQWTAKFVTKDANGIEQPISSLSSGENECFFILATIISMKLTNSVLLLDEPELHMSDVNLGPYYRILFKLAHKHDIQLIFVSHKPLFTSFAIDKFGKEISPNNDTSETKLSLKLLQRSISIDKHVLNIENNPNIIKQNLMDDEYHNELKDAIIDEYLVNRFQTDPAFRRNVQQSEKKNRGSTND